ncbi:MAG: ABC transporter permease [Candidatus Caldarchaeum sp.]
MTLEVLTEIQTLVGRELRKWVRSPFLMFMTMVQPVIWMGLFGKAFNLTGVFKISEDVLTQLPPDVTSRVGEVFNRIMASLFGVADMDYFSYMSVGMLSIVVLFTSMSSGMSVAWDRRLGFLNKLLAAPIKRGSIILAKVLSGVIRSVVQAVLVMFLAVALGAHYSIPNLLAPLAAITTLMLLSLGLSSLFISLGIRLKSWESQMAVMNLLNLPLMFASNALYPVKMMPSWLQAVASLNPITYAVDALRQSMVYGQAADVSTLLLDMAAVSLFAAVLTTVGVMVADRGLRRS